MGIKIEKISVFRIYLNMRPRNVNDDRLTVEGALIYKFFVCHFRAIIFVVFFALDQGCSALFYLMTDSNVLQSPIDCNSDTSQLTQLL